MLASLEYDVFLKNSEARLAQLVERRSHNPEVGSSILPLRIFSSLGDRSSLSSE
jgi:hypothetical protein